MTRRSQGARVRFLALLSISDGAPAAAASDPAAACNKAGQTSGHGLAAQNMWGRRSTAGVEVTDCPEAQLLGTRPELASQGSECDGIDACVKIWRPAVGRLGAGMGAADLRLRRSKEFLCHRLPPFSAGARSSTV